MIANKCVYVKVYNLQERQISDTDRTTNNFKYYTNY